MSDGQEFKVAKSDSRRDLADNPCTGQVVEKTANDPDKLERLIAAGRTTERMNWGEMHDGLVIAYQLKQAREDRGLSLSEVEEISGMDRGQLSKLENGRSNPTMSTLSKYAAAIGKRLKLTLEDSEIGEDLPAAGVALRQEP
jgi:DNA-binding phage protein